MKEVDKEKGVPPYCHSQFFPELVIYFIYFTSYACLLSIGTNIYMFVKRKESNLIQIKWNIMLRRHLISISGGQFCRFF